MSLRAKLFFSSFATLVCATSSQAQASEYFGELGQVVIGGSTGVGASWKHQYKSDKSVAKDNADVGFNPTLGVFIGKNVLLAVELGVVGKFDKDLKGQIALSGGPKLGYNINLGRGVSLLPAASASYGYQFHSTDPKNGGQQINVGLEAPFYFQVVKHGALNFGPAVTHTLTHGGATRLGLTGGVTLWI